MPQLNPARRLFSISGTFGDAQIVAAPSRVIIDLQTRNYDASGVLRRHHALANLPLETASRLRDLLNGGVSPNPRKFRQVKFSSATIASRSITCPLSRKV
jgi:hypothetical protein